jgi:hypothetical protein
MYQPASAPPDKAVTVLKVLLGLILIAGHFVTGYAINSFGIWLHFKQGIAIAPDDGGAHVVAAFAFFGQTIAALAFVPAGLVNRNRSKGLAIAIVTPLVFASLPFIAPHSLYLAMLYPVAAFAGAAALRSWR